MKLVEALKRDSQWIDVDEISSHFRSKIKIARCRHEKQTHKVIQEIKKVKRSGCQEKILIRMVEDLKKP